MSRSLIQVANTSSQAVAVDGNISLGNVIRRFGGNCQLSGDAIQISGPGYYTVIADVTIEPTDAGTVTIELQENNLQIPGAIASGVVATAEDPLTLSINTTVRQGCCCDGVDNITCVLTAGAGTVTNISLRVEKV